MKHEYVVKIQMAPSMWLPLIKFDTYQSADHYVRYSLYSNGEGIDSSDVKITHCEYKDKPIQRKHLTTQMVLTVMSQYDAWYNIDQLSRQYFPQFPYKVIHAKLKQLEKQEIIEYDWNNQHVLRIDNEELPF